MRKTVMLVACATLLASAAFGATGCCCPATGALSGLLQPKTDTTQPEEDGPPAEDATGTAEADGAGEAEAEGSGGQAAEPDDTSAGYVPPPGVEPQDLFVIIYASEASKEAAETKRARYQGQYGDAAPILAVDQSVHYDGLKPGYWIVVSGYRDRETAAQDLDWAKQHGIPGYIKQATKLCDDEIEVFELGD